MNSVSYSVSSDCCFEKISLDMADAMFMLSGVLQRDPWLANKKMLHFMRYECKKFLFDINRLWSAHTLMAIESGRREMLGIYDAPVQSTSLDVKSLFEYCEKYVEFLDELCGNSGAFRRLVFSDSFEIGGFNVSRHDALRSLNSLIEKLSVGCDRMYIANHELFVIV